jgi:ribosomal protein S8E
MAILWNGVLLLAVKARGIPKRLVRSGTAVFGRVVEIKVSPRPGAPRQIFYEYRSGAGDKIVANDIITGSAKISQGQEVVVLYDPANPRRAILYDFCDFRAG